MNPEVAGDLRQRHTRTTVPGDPHNVLTELSGIGLGHCNIFPACSTSKRSVMSQICAAAPRTPDEAALGDTNIAAISELSPEDLALVTSFIDALVTKTRLKVGA